MLINKGNVISYNTQLEAALDRYIKVRVEAGETDCVDMARWVKKNYKDSIALHILNFSDVTYFLDNKTVYPATVQHFLYYISDYVFNRGNIKDVLSLAEQNEKSRKYIHFDFSVKKTQTINDITPALETWTLEEILRREG